MKIIKQSWEFMAKPNGYAILKLLEAAGRVCYKTEGKIGEDTAPEFVRKRITTGHESVIEHASVSVRIITDRGVTHEIVRHRLASYSQESTRYCDYAGGHVAFVLPVWCEDIEPGEYDEYIASAVEAENDWLNAMWNIELAYRDLREKGWSPQQARTVLPNSLKTEIIMTANVREWRHFFRLRCSPAAHPQMRALALDMLAGFAGVIPVVFDDIYLDTIDQPKGE
jgi:thymidylate synthase (FAD)